MRDWDPFDPEALRDPPALHAEMRARCPVAFTDRAEGFWALFMYEDARSIVQARKARPLDPRDDLATGLLHTEIDGERLDDETVVGILRLVLTAGHNSTTSALGIVALYLATHQEVQDLLRQQPE